MIYCPNCGAQNADNTWQCLCGHYFTGNAPRAPAQRLASHIPSAEQESAIRFASDHDSEVDLFGEAGRNAAQASAPRPINEQFHFRGDGSTLFSIYLANLIFTICTLGVYYFWAKAKLRRFVYGQTEFAGDRFDYHGTGKELLIGWLKAILIFGGVGLLYQLIFASSTNAGIQVAGTIFFYAALGVIIPIAVVGTQRYRLSRTSWRSIRFSFRGHTEDLLRQYVRDSLLVAITFSLYYPYFQNNLRRFIVLNSYYGSQPFDYDGEGRDLFRYFFVLLLLILPTLGFYWFWYTAQKHRYYWDHTRFGQVRFRSAMSGGGLAKLKITNFVLIVFTLGLAYPWAVARSVEYQLSCLSCSGPVDLDTIFQQASTASATGEGLVDMLDAGVLDIDFGF